jgi:hypothetical protein
MTVAGTTAYKFLAHATYLHVYTLIGMSVSVTQEDSTFDLLACNLVERGGHETDMYLENICMQGHKCIWACKCNLQMYPHYVCNLHMPLTSMQVTV